jgi:hypothetical protein
MRKKPTNKAKIIAAAPYSDRFIAPIIYSMTIKKDREPRWQWLKLSLSYPTVSNYTVIYKTRINS